MELGCPKGLTAMDYKDCRDCPIREENNGWLFCGMGWGGIQIPPCPELLEEMNLDICASCKNSMSDGFSCICKTTGKKIDW